MEVAADTARSTPHRQIVPVTSTYGAPRERPPGMARSVPYEPVLTHRNPVFDWFTETVVKLWYGTPVSKLPPKLVDWYRRGQVAPISGRPGAQVPDPADAWRVGVIGDMGEGSPAQARVAELLVKWAPSHVATVGDNVYPMGREVDWAKRFDPYYGRLRSRTTWQPALGNHDYYGGDLRPYFSRFPQLAGQAFYTWKLGPAQFFVLDSEQRLDAASSQRAWLEQQLAASTAPYRVVQLHRPMISSHAGGDGRARFESLGPLLAKHGVQLVLTGHEHGYERSQPHDGAVHVVTGGGGGFSIGYPLPLPDRSEVRTARHHYLQLVFDAAQMVVRAVDDRGTTFDTFTVKPHGAVSAAAAGAAALRAPAAV